MMRELCDTSSDEKFRLILQNEIEEECRIHGLCTRCFEKLRYKEYSDFRGWYMGETSYENMTEQYCPNCNRITEDLI